MYTEKCMALLNEEVHHECRDQTKSIHSKEFKQLLDLEISIGIKSSDKYLELLPTGDTSPPARFYCLPKIHKANTPFGPVISACVHPLTNLIPNQNSTKYLKEQKVAPDETLVSFDVSALFTIIPVTVGLEVLNNKFT